MENEKYYCWGPGCKNEIVEPKSCCSGQGCGCAGQPMDPPFCSNNCFDAHMKMKSDAPGSVAVLFADTADGFLRLLNSGTQYTAADKAMRSDIIRRHAMSSPTVKER